MKLKLIEIGFCVILIFLFIIFLPYSLIENYINNKNNKIKINKELSKLFWDFAMYAPVGSVLNLGQIKNTRKCKNENYTTY
jgi:hypothetical protein